MGESAHSKLLASEDKRLAERELRAKHLRLPLLCLSHHKHQCLRSLRQLLSV